MTNTSTIVWDQMVFFNQTALHNILNGCVDLGTVVIRAAVATLTIEQQGNTICFLMHNTEELFGVPDSWGIQAVANVCNLLDYLFYIIAFGFSNSQATFLKQTYFS